MNSTELNLLRFEFFRLQKPNENHDAKDSRRSYIKTPNFFFDRNDRVCPQFSFEVFLDMTDEKMNFIYKNEQICAIMNHISQKSAFLQLTHIFDQWSIQKSNSSQI